MRCVFKSAGLGVVWSSKAVEGGISDIVLRADLNIAVLSLGTM